MKTILKGNPKQVGQPVGIGKTVKPDYRFKTIWHYKRYWAEQIAITSKNIHK